MMASMANMWHTKGLPYTQPTRRLTWLLPLLCLLLWLLPACSNFTQDNQAGSSNGTQDAPPLTLFTSGRFREYTLPQAHSGLMRPAVDSQGRIWFSEMSRGYLAVLDPRTRALQQMTPPESAGGLMGVTVAPDDTIWFAEEYGNFIGHYDPRSGQFKNYHLPTLSIPDPQDAQKTLKLSSAPNEIVFDPHGNAWFTELNADSVGMLNTKTGKVQQYPLSAQPSVQKLNPYGLALDRQGMLWITLSSSAQLARLDPASGKVQLYPLPDPQLYLMQVTSDRQGTIWATGFNKLQLLKFEPASTRFTSYLVSSKKSQETGGTVYDVVALSNGDIWMSVPSENALARLDAKSDTLTFTPLPTSGAYPLGLALSSDETQLWFTESASDKIGSYQLG